MMRRGSTPTKVDARLAEKLGTPNTSATPCIVCKGVLAPKRYICVLPKGADEYEGHWHFHYACVPDDIAVLIAIGALQ